MTLKQKIEIAGSNALNSPELLQIKDDVKFKSKFIELIQNQLPEYDPELIKSTIMAEMIIDTYSIPNENAVMKTSAEFKKKIMQKMLYISERADMKKYKTSMPVFYEKLMKEVAKELTGEDLRVFNAITNGQAFH